MLTSKYFFDVLFFELKIKLVTYDGAISIFASKL
jgi:hypothetical protein